jgi:hypothetical protein
MGYYRSEGDPEKRYRGVEDEIDPPTSFGRRRRSSRRRSSRRSARRSVRRSVSRSRLAPRAAPPILPPKLAPQPQTLKRAGVALAAQTFFLALWHRGPRLFFLRPARSNKEKQKAKKKWRRC